MGKKVSISSISEKLGVSITTVSFILNGKAQEKRISEKMVKKVMDYVNEIDYKPSSLARSLRTGKTNTIGLIVEDISYPFFSTIAKEIEEKAYLNGYKIIYSSTENNVHKAKELIEMFKDKHVDGYIIVPPDGIEKELIELSKSGKPVVLIDRFLDAVETDYVVVDNAESSYQATQHLIKNGFKNIAFITINSLQSQMMDRLRGYEKALKENNLQQHVKEISYNGSDDAVKHVISFLERKKEIDAIFFSTNYLCVSGLKALKKMNLKIPSQVAVISFDDYELFEMYSPSISSIAQPIQSIAENAINILLSRLKKSTAIDGFYKTVLSNCLIERESSIK